MRHKILIVDDDPDDTEMTKRVLSKSGFEVKVEAVLHGEAALELLRKEDDLPSLILLDLKMPGMGGIDTLRRIRADERLKNITVVILTNSLLEADKKESYDAGANGFLQKAFDIDRFGRDVLSALERWLER
ncbi:MAG: response regulator [Nitrospirae bacterium]|nr:response regulator [Nitrospirota bacterium]